MYYLVFQLDFCKQVIAREPRLSGRYRPVGRIISPVRRNKLAVNKRLYIVYSNYTCF